jgi:hypothetical protein
MQLTALPRGLRIERDETSISPGLCKRSGVSSFEGSFMFAYAVLLLAVLSRVLPPAFHATAWNLTAVGGGLLFFGSRMRGNGTESRGNWGVFARLASAVAVLAATDYYLTVFAYGFPFHIRGYMVTWAWYAAVCLIGMGLLTKPSVLRMIVGVLASATSFFLLSNFMVWASGTMYPQTRAGLAECYAMGLPFYRNDLVSTAITAGALFGLPVLAAKIAESMEAGHQPLA